MFKFIFFVLFAFVSNQCLSKQLLENSISSNKVILNINNQKSIHIKDGVENTISCFESNKIWSLDAHVLNSNNISFAANNEKIFITNGANIIFCINLNNGELLWTKKIDHDIINTIEIFDNKIFIVSAEYKMYALDQSTGNICWRNILNTKTGVIKKTNINRAGYFGKNFIIPFLPDTNLCVLERQNLNQLWCRNVLDKYNIKTYANEYGMNSMPILLKENFIIASFRNIGTICFDLHYGNIIWTIDPIAEEKIFEIEDNKIAFANKNGDVFVASLEGEIVSAFYAKKQNTLSTRNNHIAVLYHQNILFLSNNTKNITLVYLSTGKRSKVNASKLGNLKDDLLAKNKA